MRTLLPLENPDQEQKKDEKTFGKDGRSRPFSDQSTWTKPISKTRFANKSLIKCFSQTKSKGALGVEDASLRV